MPPTLADGSSASMPALEWAGQGSVVPLARLPPVQNLRLCYGASRFSAKGEYVSIIGWIILGLIAGFIASKIVESRGQGFFINILLGIVGGVVGGWLFGAFRRDWDHRLRFVEHVRRGDRRYRGSRCLSLDPPTCAKLVPECENGIHG